jgi:hypothetical protein
MDQPSLKLDNSCLHKSSFLRTVLWYDSGEITNNMQPCNRTYYSTVCLRLNMFRVAHRSSSGALTVFAASGLHTGMR